MRSHPRHARARVESIKLAASIGLVGLLLLPVAFLVGCLAARMALGV